MNLQSYNNLEINSLNDLVQLKKQILSHVNQGVFVSNHLRFRGESEFYEKFGASLNREKENTKFELFELKLLEEKRVNFFYEQIEKYGIFKNIPYLGKFTDDWTKRIKTANKNRPH